ncbi:MAG: YrhK family protein [Actinomycetota bacterium]
MASGAQNNDRSNDLDLPIGRDEIVIRNRYEVLGIINDVVIGVLFLVGSILFFSPSTTTVGTWFFVVGSAQLLVRPCIRLTRRVHLKRFDSVRDRERYESEW